MTILLGISGLASSGKDTIADYLVLKYGFVKISLADKIKQICKDLFDMSTESLWGPSHLRNVPDERWPRPLTSGGSQEFLTPRFACQIFGTEAGRACNEEVWLRATLKMAGQVMNGMAYSKELGTYESQIPKSCAGVVIPDVRFKNEISGVKEAGGFVWRVRPSTFQQLQDWQMHPSEVEQMSVPDNDFHHLLLNDKELGFEPLHKAVDQAMSYFSTDHGDSSPK